MKPMTSSANINLQPIAASFQVEGRFMEAVTYTSGHINDTYAVCFQAGKDERRYILQRINHLVFKQPELLMENIARVTHHARAQVLASGGDPDRETLTLVPALDGRPFYRAPDGSYWRTYLFIDGARTYDQVEDLRHVYTAARSFGKFQKMLSSLPGGRLHETIPDFHHTRKRFEAFCQALADDPAGRAVTVKPEVEFVLVRADQTSQVVDLLEQGLLPERVTHNDTKLNNVLIDDHTGEGVCVIDLDTVMPGSVLYDFGDAVRVGACTGAEDELDLSKIGFSLAMFERLAHGYLEAARDFLTPLEIEHLAFSARLITLEQGIRFLTDYLNGDIYYKISRPGHNLDRCRTQLKMVAEMEGQEGAMKTVLNHYL
jgi:Ser/Thr protein kinase RdoA (MazF antagonist)